MIVMPEQTKPEEIDDGVYISNPADSRFKSLVKDDLARTRQESKLVLDESLHEALLVQTVLGHAQNGHKVFNRANARYPFATITDIIEAADLEVAKIKSIRQELIDKVFDWAELAKKDKTNSLVIDGQPLLGVEFLRGYHIDPEYVLKGMVLAGMMDNYGWRQRTVAKYEGKTITGQPLIIGGGETYLVDSNILKERKPFLIEDLAEEEISNESIHELRSQGVITAPDNPHAEVAYIRRKKGLGTSDDAAFIIMGEMYKKEGLEKALSTFLGGFIVDGMDTYDKCTSRPIEGGYDEELGLEIREALPSLVNDDEITALIYYSAKGNGEKLVSSSHKRLIQVVENAVPQIPALLHHHKFLEVGKYAPFQVGFERMPSSQFYKSVGERINHYQKHHLYRK